MATAPAQLYQEQPARETSRADVDRALELLAQAKSRYYALGLRQRVLLAKACIVGVRHYAKEWVDAACLAKGIPPGSPARSEEIAAGPVAVLRQLQLICQVLEDMALRGQPTLPGQPFVGPSGGMCVPLLPVRRLFDATLFRGFRAAAWMQSEVTRDNLPMYVAGRFRVQAQTVNIALVLGAGNVASIPATDALGKLFLESRVVLVKMNPVNDYLGEIFESAFFPLVNAGYLRIVYGGAEVGAYAVDHPLVDEVHITGSVHAHDAIVWGPPGSVRDERLAAHRPRLSKRITSELGNVTPWVIVPGPYTERELDFQAENVAASITNNASFNCIATKLIVTCRGWPARERFLDKVEAALARTPPRKAYYPGAASRFARFAGRQAPDDADERLPWALLRDVDLDARPLLCREESFVCVASEVAIDAADEAQFLDRIADFVNERVWGTLGAAITIHPRSRQRVGNEARLWRCVSNLRYGTVAINHWPALAYALMGAPWGGFPGATLADPQSGLGWVHNAFLLDGVQKTVLEGPLVVRPRPLWFASHRRANTLAWRLVDLYAYPSWWQVMRLLPAALTG